MFADGDAEYEMAELRAERDHERRQRRDLMAHPDCRDPDHPGCDGCQTPPPADMPEVCWGCDDLDKVNDGYQCNGFGADLTTINGTPLPCRACRHQYKEAA